MWVENLRIWFNYGEEDRKGETNYWKKFYVKKQIISKVKEENQGEF